MLSKSACSRCRASKLKCDRAFPACGRCDGAGQPCVYAPKDRSLRIRNQTDKAERHAVTAWRARANAPSKHVAVRGASSELERPIATKVEILAQHRFLYDFSESRTSLSAMSFGEMIPSFFTKDGHSDPNGVKTAFVATSLANFHKRHRDSRAASLSASALSRALITLRRSLVSSNGEITQDLVLMAILLGLHQNISHDKHLVGSWIHHFRGSVNLLEAAAARGLDDSSFACLSQLIEKQALCVSLRAELPFPLPSGMRKMLELKTDLRSRYLILGARAADYCASLRRWQHCSDFQLQCDLREPFESLDNAFDDLEAELQATLSYSACSADANLYADWYRRISAYPGGPSSVHYYSSVDDVAIWNFERMARTKLLSTVLDCGLYDDVPAPSQPTMNRIKHQSQQLLSTKIRALVEDTCASVYYSLSQRADGMRPVSSFEDIPGAKGYALISPMTVAKECIGRLAPSSPSVGRFEWIGNVLQVMEDGLAVSEAWCWSDGDEEAARVNIERELAFDN